MDTIAAQAGVSKPLVYRHFHNRSEALLAVVDQQSERLLEALALPADSLDSPDFEAIVTGFLSFAADHPRSFRLLFQLVDGSSGPPKRRLDRLRGDLSQALSQAVLTRANHREEVALAISDSRIGQLMVSILEGVAGGLVHGEDPRSVARTLHRLLRPDRVVAALMPDQDSTAALDSW